MGTVDFDVTEIDLSSVRLGTDTGSAAPNNGPPGPPVVFEDVATPFDGELCDCHDSDGDAIIDLMLKFDIQELVTATDLASTGTEFVELTVTGSLLDGTPFSASDCVRIVPPGDVDGDGLVGISDLLIVLSDWGSCHSCAADANGDTHVNITDLLIILSNWT